MSIATFDEKSHITTFIATGDTFMTRNLSEKRYEGFSDLYKIINEHDVRFTNLEITIHDSEGYPSAFSGGTWAMADPTILDDLKEFGFNLYNTANNHSMDYCHGGLLATINHLKQRKMLFAGTGKNLFEASKPTYLDTPNARVALIGVCSTFHDSDIAGNQSISLVGRPGLNPLRYKKIFDVTKDDFETLQKISKSTQINAAKELSIRNGYAKPFAEGEMEFGGISFRCSTENSMHSIPNGKDMQRIENMIREARLQADYVLVSFHSHEFASDNKLEPAEFAKIFCHNCIDAGADAILGHGPHELRGIEIYKDRPIFYSLGNFIFETDTVNLQPADAYENANLPYDTMVGSYINHRNQNGTKGYIIQPEIWQSVMASFEAINGTIKTIKLYPITLGMGCKRSKLGIPMLTDDVNIIHYLAKLSDEFGTKISIKDGIGTIDLSADITKGGV